MFLLPLLLLIFPEDSLRSPRIGFLAGTGIPFGGNGILSEILKEGNSGRYFGFSGGLGLSRSGSENPQSNYFWIGNSLSFVIESGQKIRLAASAGLVSHTLAASRPKGNLPTKKLLIGSSFSGSCSYRAARGFHLQGGLSLVLLQNPMEKSNRFLLSVAPFAGIGWAWDTP